MPKKRQMTKRRKSTKTRKMPKRRKPTKNVGKKRIGGMRSARTQREYYIESWGQPHEKVFDTCYREALDAKLNQVNGDYDDPEYVNLQNSKEDIAESYFQAKARYYKITRRDPDKFQRRLDFKKQLCDTIKKDPILLQHPKLSQEALQTYAFLPPIRPLD